MRMRASAAAAGAQHLSQTDNWSSWTQAIDRAAEYGVDAVILADPGLMAYATKTHLQLRLHLSVQGSATSYEAINWYRVSASASSARCCRALSMAQVESVVANTPVEIEVFGFGGLCVMVEGRCALSATPPASRPTATAPARLASTVRWKTPARRGAPQRHPHRPLRRGERAGYPTLCQGRLRVNDETYYALEEPTSLTPSSCCPSSRASASARSRSRAASAVRPTSPRSPRCGAALDKLNHGGAEAFSVLPAWDGRSSTRSPKARVHPGAYYRP